MTAPARSRHPDAVVCTERLYPGGPTELSLRLVEQLQQPVGRAGDDGPVADDDDRALDQDRVGDHGVEQLVTAGGGQVQLLVDGLLRADDLPGIVGAEQAQDLFQLLLGGRLLEVADVGGVDAPLLQDPLGGLAVRAPRVEIDRDIHGMGVYGP